MNKENLIEVFYNFFLSIFSCSGTSEWEYYDEEFCREFWTEPNLPYEKTCIYARSAMGTEKTKNLFKLFDKLDIKNNDISICILSSRVSLSEKLFMDFKPYGFTIYNEEKGALINHRQIVQCESVFRLWRTFDIIIIDECYSFRPQLYSHTTHKSNLTLNQKVFKLISDNCRMMILMDADIDYDCFNFYNILCDGKLQVKYNERIPKKGKITLYDGEQAIYIDLIISKLKKGKKVYVPTMSYNFGAKLKMRIDEHNKTKSKKINYEFYHKDHPLMKYIEEYDYSLPLDDLKKTIYDVNVEWAKLDCLIYSPTITQGISFETKHFDAMYGYYTGLSGTPFIFFQLIGRIRNCKKFHVFFSRRHTEKIDINWLKKNKYMDVMLKNTETIKTLYSNVLNSDNFDIRVDADGYFEYVCREYRDLYVDDYFKLNLFTSVSKIISQNVFLYLCKMKGYKFITERPIHLSTKDVYKIQEIKLTDERFKEWKTKKNKFICDLATPLTAYYNIGSLTHTELETLSKTYNNLKNEYDLKSKSIKEINVLDYPQIIGSEFESDINGYNVISCKLSKYVYQIINNCNYRITDDEYIILFGFKTHISNLSWELGELVDSSQYNLMVRGGDFEDNQLIVRDGVVFRFRAKTGDFVEVDKTTHIIPRNTFELKMITTLNFNNVHPSKNKIFLWKCVRKLYKLLNVKNSLDFETRFCLSLLIDDEKMINLKNEILRYEDADEDTIKSFSFEDKTQKNNDRCIKLKKFIDKIVRNWASFEVRKGKRKVINGTRYQFYNIGIPEISLEDKSKVQNPEHLIYFNYISNCNFVKELKILNKQFQKENIKIMRQLDEMFNGDEDEDFICDSDDERMESTLSLY